MPHDETRQLVDAVAVALRDGDRAVLAVSGGIDSMTLLDVAANTVDRGRLTVATFDHRTGSAAAAAARLVEQRAAALGVECRTGLSSTPLEGEAAFRDARWSFLRGIADERSATVWTAHTEDDQIETVLMRLMRGTGPRGLASLSADSDVVRPFLAVRRPHIEAYAASHELQWIEDPTNATPAYFRNRVRGDHLPALRRVRPSIDEELLAIAREAAGWRREVDAFCRAIDGVRLLSGGRGIQVPVAAFAVADEAAAKILWPSLAGRAAAILDRRGIERLASFTARSRVGSRIQLSGGWEVVRGRNSFVLRQTASERATPEPFALSDGTRVGDWTFRAQLAASLSSSRDSWSAWLPTDAPLVVRPWRAGDAISIGNSGSRRKVKHLLSAAGVTGHERAGWPVVLSGNDIVWIPGVRRTDAATARPGRPGLAFVCEYDNR